MKYNLPINYTKLKWWERRDVRNQYVKEQDGKCMWCNAQLKDDPPENMKNKFINQSKFPKKFFDHPVHLQHCHKTDMTEGAVHAKCNAIMWQYHNK